MKFIRFSVNHNSPQWGVLEEDAVYQLETRPTGPPTIRDFANHSYVSEIQAAISRGAVSTVPRDSVKPLAPIPEPGKIIAVGLNYQDHAEEQGSDPPERPLLFGKATSCVTNPGDPIVHPADIEQVDYEVELGVIIGKPASHVSRDDAFSYVGGYTIMNDVSARDAQFSDNQWFRGKSYDTFGPMGPVLRSPTTFDPHDVSVSLTVNGETKQSSHTTNLLFGIDELIEYISGIMTLKPGDVIATGTPGGVGVFRDPPDLLEPGDHVAATIEGIGTLENPVIDA